MYEYVLSWLYFLICNLAFKKSWNQGQCNVCCLCAKHLLVSFNYYCSFVVAAVKKYVTMSRDLCYRGNVPNLLDYIELSFGRLKVCYILIPSSNRVIPQGNSWNLDSEHKICLISKSGGLYSRNWIFLRPEIMPIWTWQRTISLGAQLISHIFWIFMWSTLTSRYRGTAWYRGTLSKISLCPLYQAATVFWKSWPGSSPY